MKTNKDTSLRQCFVLTVRDVTKLCDALVDFSQDIKIEIKCANGLNRSMETLGDLLKFENPPNKEIRELVLSARTNDYDRSARLRFMSADYSAIWLSLDGPEDAVVKLNSLLEDLIPSLKPWYTPLVRLDFIIMGFLVLVAAYVGLLVSAATGVIANVKTSESDLKSTAIAWLLIFAIVVGLLVFGWMLNRSRKMIFPIGVFALGQGQKRHTEKEWLRSTVIVGFFVSLAAGIVVLLLTR